LGRQNQSLERGTGLTQQNRHPCFLNKMHTGPKGGVIITKNLKNGTYVLTNELLTIKWDDNKVEKDKIKFIDTRSFVLTIAGKTKKTEHTFRRVIDEEVEEK
jgi:hypothetical protein